MNSKIVTENEKINSLVDETKELLNKDIPEEEPQKEIGPDISRIGKSSRHYSPGKIRSRNSNNQTKFSYADPTNEDLDKIPKINKQNRINKPKPKFEKPRHKEHDDSTDSQVNLENNKEFKRDTLDSVIKNADTEFIVQNKQNSLNVKSKRKPKIWLHRVDSSVLQDIHENKVIGGKKQFSKPVTNGDRIFFVSTIAKRIQIFGVSVVEERFTDNKEYYEYYGSKTKLKLKGMKYFNKPVISTDIAEKLSFVKNPKKAANSFKAEWREITEDDFKTILFRRSPSKEFPSYLKEITFVEDEFILNTVKAIYNILKTNEDRKQIEIKKLISILKRVLDSYEMNMSYDEVFEFYTKNIWKLGLKHNPSRDSEKFVELYNSAGGKKNFSYLSLE